MALYAISYDDPEALADFAAAHEITYPLLADPESDVIRAFGILNTLVPEEEAEFHGMPFPGTYVTDPDGVVAAKFFEHSLAIRPGPEQLLRAAVGEDIDAGPSAEPVDVVTVAAYLDGPNLAAGLTRELVVEFAIPDGQHLYGEPVPEGLTATTVEFDPEDDLMVFEPILPPTREHQLATGEILHVFDGVVRVRIPVTVRGGHPSSTSDDGEPANRLGDRVIRGTAHFQTCDDAACALPQSLRFEVVVHVEPVIVGDFGRERPRSKAMNGRDHMQRLLARREKRGSRTAASDNGS